METHHSIFQGEFLGNADLALSLCLACFSGRASDDSTNNIWKFPVQPHQILS